MQKLFKKFHTGVLVFVAALVLSGCTLSTTQPASSPSPAVTASPELTTGKMKANYEFVATESGTVAIDLIVSQVEIETKEYGSAGKFVTSINGLAGNNEYYWAFYVNDEYAQQGASQTILQKGDTIKFVYEAVTPNK